MTIEAEALRAVAPAKINLFLHVGDKRPDGYHALQSLVAFAHVGDELALSPDRALRLVLRGQFAGALEGEKDNLVLKAARALRSHAGIERGAYISLTKNLPVASGMGGGSADAAAALRGLARLWNLKPTRRELHEIAETLGSDVPVCITSTPQWMEGRGEILTEVNGLPPLHAVLVNPGEAVATGKVFAALKERRGTGMRPPKGFAGFSDVIGYLEDTTNDLEAPARMLAPVVGKVLAMLEAQEGTRLARMAGSGATCFGLFETAEAAAVAALTISERKPRWWVVSTTIAPPSPALLPASV